MIVGTLRIRCQHHVPHERFTFPVQTFKISNISNLSVVIIISIVVIFLCFEIVWRADLFLHYSYWTVMNPNIFNWYISSIHLIVVFHSSIKGSNCLKKQVKWHRCRREDTYSSFSWAVWCVMLSCVIRQVIGEVMLCSALNTLIFYSTYWAQSVPEESKTLNNPTDKAKKDSACGMINVKHCWPLLVKTGTVSHPPPQLQVPVSVLRSIKTVITHHTHARSLALQKPSTRYGKDLLRGCLSFKNEINIWISKHTVMCMYTEHTETHTEKT